MISKKKGRYPFITANTDSSDKNDTHWWSILDIEPRADLIFFDTFGVDCLKSFIIQDNKKVVEKIFFATEQLTRTDNKITLVNIKFNLYACKSFSLKELDNLKDTARDFFYFVQSFGNKLKLRDFVNIWVVEDRTQDLDPVTLVFFEYTFTTTCLIPTKTAK